MTEEGAPTKQQPNSVGSDTDTSTIERSNSDGSKAPGPSSSDVAIAAGNPEQLDDDAPALARPAAAASPWTFVPADHQMPNFHSKSTQDFLEKWGLQQWTHAQRYKYSGPWNAKHAEAFIAAFLNSPGVQGTFKVATREKLVPFLGHVSAVSAEALRTTVTNMNFFDKLTDAGVVRPSGHIVRMYEDDFDGVTVSDALRELLVNEDSEHAYVYSDEEKQEFIFQLFKWLAIGGTMMQFEDEAAPYFDTAKAIYKDFLTVFRNPGSGNVEIANCLFVFAREAASTSELPTYTDAFCAWLPLRLYLCSGFVSRI